MRRVQAVPNNTETTPCTEAFENSAGKEENTNNRNFLVFQECSLSIHKQI